MPGVCAPKWPKDIKRRFISQVLPSKNALTSLGNYMRDRPEDDYVSIEIDGTTFSGLSTRTTFGNTLRSIMYMYFYMDESNLESTDPWLSKNSFVIAAGDDTVVWTIPQFAERLRQNILRLTTRNKDS